ncbi:hypothetical protein BS78_K217000 [Paspalum vaginatum]|uniref:Uncharacterized protein n=1 Tax=Paspalum vaginatum TaxID=158149 RepID=A0A9W7X7T7_9POAL|nr:hypothetical protein BS78_K217000 [Paspalum vaginatum]KAJ1253643.1 hypothetical protein BS78_K217000 [Paspalum vaginatum]
MPPGRMAGAWRCDLGGEAVTEYEKERAKTLMRNNQTYQRLGLCALTSILNKKHETRHMVLSTQALYTKLSKVMTRKKKSARLQSKLPSIPSTLLQEQDHQNECWPLSNQSKQQESLDKRLVVKICLMDSTQDSLALATPRDYEEQTNNPDEGAITDMIQVPRGLSVGKELDLITRGLGVKISIHIAEGKTRLEPPMQATKFAFEGGIAIRLPVPIFTQWKHYKDKKNKEHVQD